jgi:CubicO group peptidase (beta-lactamase class C family)
VGGVDHQAPRSGVGRHEPQGKEAPLTSRHLLSHRGGLARIPVGLVKPWEHEGPRPLAEVVRAHAKVVARPGQRPEYSSAGYVLSAYLVSQLAGTSFDRAMKDRLFDPLGMTRTAFEPLPAVVENMAIPYEYRLPETERTAGWPGGAPDVVPVGQLRGDT